MADYQVKPRVFIETRPGRDFANRSNNLWAGVNPFRPTETWYMGMVAIFSLEEALQSYLKKITRWERRLTKKESQNA